MVQQQLIGKRILKPMINNLKILFNLNPEAAFDQDPHWVYQHDPMWVFVNKFKWLRQNRSNHEIRKLFNHTYLLNNEV